jgi:putative intracellular protease/amidase
MRTQKNRIVIVLTSHDELGNTGKKTGYHLEELAVPYLEFKRSGADIVIASPKGGQPPVDPKSAQQDSAEIQQFLDDPEAQRRMRSTVKVADVEGSIDVLFFPGGHGPMWDLATSSQVTDLIEQVWMDGGVVGALCHGPAALLNANGEDGKPLLQGKRVNGFTDAEEKEAGLYDVVPFHLEEKLRALGGKFEHSGKQQAHVAVDGRLITGQNPASAKGVAQAVLAALDLMTDHASRDSQDDLVKDGVNLGKLLDEERAQSQDERQAQDNGDGNADNMKTVRPTGGNTWVENRDGQRASNGRVLSPEAVSEEIASRYRSGSPHGEAPAAPDNADDFLPSGMTANARSEPNPRRATPLKSRGTLKLAEGDPAPAVLHDDAPPEKRSQAKRTEAQEMDKADAANKGSRAAHKNEPPTRNTRR